MAEARERFADWLTVVQRGEVVDFEIVRRSGGRCGWRVHVVVVFVFVVFILLLIAARLLVSARTDVVLRLKRRYYVFVVIVYRVCEQLCARRLREYV